MKRGSGQRRRKTGITTEEQRRKRGGGQSSDKKERQRRGTRDRDSGWVVAQTEADGIETDT